jgi:tRNA(fMet)-specific endonuclease VapC
MNKALLDTNAYIRLVAGDERILAHLEEVDQIYMSVFGLGELYAGYRAGDREKQNKQILEKFLDNSDVVVLDATRVTAENYGLIKSALKKSGRIIPLNDIWIAAQALETGSVLVTYDSHFLAVPGLRIWDEISATGL